eukprot:7085953-Prymnesium_polylepis.1
MAVDGQYAVLQLQPGGQRLALGLEVGDPHLRRRTLAIRRERQPEPVVLALLLDMDHSSRGANGIGFDAASRRRRRVTGRAGGAAPAEASFCTAARRHAHARRRGFDGGLGKP